MDRFTRNLKLNALSVALYYMKCLPATKPYKLTLSELVEGLRPIFNELGISLIVPRLRGKCYVVDCYAVYFDGGKMGIACKLNKHRKCPIILVEVDEPKFAAHLLGNEVIKEIASHWLFLFTDINPVYCVSCGKHVDVMCDDCRIRYPKSRNFSLCFRFEVVRDKNYYALKNKWD